MYISLIVLTGCRRLCPPCPVTTVARYVTPTGLPCPVVKGYPLPEKPMNDAEHFLARALACDLSQEPMNFCECLSGPDMGFRTDDCMKFDLDNDGDVDLWDFAALQAWFWRASPLGIISVCFTHCGPPREPCTGWAFLFSYDGVIQSELVCELDANGCCTWMGLGSGVAWIVRWWDQE